MNNVVPLKRPEAEVKQTQGVGAAFCMQCNHTWEATAPTGVVDLECPECKTMKGHFKFPFAPPSTHLWTCNCSNQLFNATPEGIFCPNCGEWQVFPR